MVRHALGLLLQTGLKKPVRPWEVRGRGARETTGQLSNPALGLSQEIISLGNNDEVQRMSTEERGREGRTVFSRFDLLRSSAPLCGDADPAPNLHFSFNAVFQMLE